MIDSSLPLGRDRCAWSGNPPGFAETPQHIRNARVIRRDVAATIFEGSET
jgi:hypothetical protein